MWAKMIKKIMAKLIFNGYPINLRFGNPGLTKRYRIIVGYRHISLFIGTLLLGGAAHVCAGEFSASVSGSGTSLSIVGHISPDSSDLGETVQLYNAASFGQQLYIRSVNGWELWQPESDLPAYTQTVAEENITTTIAEQIDVSQLEGAQIYLGYGRDQMDLLGGKYALVHTIESPTALNFSHDFEPAIGKVDKEGEGPWDKRLLMAYSEDGVHFTATGRVLADQANVPDMVRDKNGHIYLYFTGWTVGDQQNTSAVAISTDSGISWAFKYIQLNGFSAPPVDPDIILLDEHTFRLFFTAPNGNVPAIHYADSNDGVVFDYGGVVWAEEGEGIIDSTTMKIGSQWHMLVLGGGHAVSSDALHFEPTEPLNFSIQGVQYTVSNEIPLASSADSGSQTEAGVRLFGFAIPNQDIRSFISQNGHQWEVESGQRLLLDSSSGAESAYIKDPAIVQLTDGRYLMVYVSLIP